MQKLDYNNLVQDFVADLKLSVEEDNPKLLNIIEFIDQEVDLGIDLTIQQSTILKAYYNIPLTDEEISILEYWKANNRCTWESDAVYQILVLESGRRSGKCISENSILLTDKGLLKIKNLIIVTKDSPKDSWHDIETLTVSNEGISKTSFTNNVFYKGKSPTKIITSKSGYTLEGTDDHKIKVINAKGNISWRKLKDLKQTDYVCIHRNTNLWSHTNYPIKTKRKLDVSKFPETLNHDWAYFIGLLTSSGKRQKAIAVYYALNNIDKEDIFNFVIKLGLEDSFIQYLTNDGKDNIGTNNVDIKEYLAAIGVDTASKTYYRSTPNLLMSATPDLVKEYISGLFDSVGCLNYREKCFDFYLDSKQLTIELQLLLLNFGIHSSLQRERATHGYRRLVVNEARSQLLLCQLLNSKLTRNKNALLKWESNISNQGKNIFIPNMGKYIKEIIKSFPELSEPINNLYFDNEFNKINEREIDNLINLLKTHATKSFNEIITKLNELKSLDYIYEEITLFRESESVCYDLNVDSTHEYVANGLTTHNSSLAAVIAVYEFYCLSKMKSPQEKYGIARSTPISIIVLATTATQGKKTIFRNVVGILKNSKSAYFKRLEDEGLLFVGKEEISLEHKLLYIYSGNSQSGAQVGGTVKALIMDEVARFKDKDGKSNAIELWTNLGISTTTFGLEARLVGISSAWYEDDAIEQLYEKTKSDVRSLGIKTRSWDLNPIHASRDNPVVASYYNSDPKQAALEYEGIRPSAVSAFLNSDEVKAAFRGRSLITARKADTERNRQKNNLVSLIIDQISDNCSSVKSLVCHLDPGITSDSYALSFGHNEQDENNRQIAVIDGIFSWEPTYNTEVSISNVQDLIIEIHNIIPIRKLTSDHYNSAETLQRLRHQGIPCESTFFSNRVQVSMYSLVRQLCHENRLIIPYDSLWSPVALSELCKVQLIRGTKIDHSPSGSKDIADTIAGVCWALADRLLIDINSLNATLPVEVLKYSSGNINNKVGIRKEDLLLNSSTNVLDARSRVLGNLSARHKWLRGLNKG
jgi:intein/homing endonuclease